MSVDEFVIGATTLAVIPVPEAAELDDRSRLRWLSFDESSRRNEKHLRRPKQTDWDGQLMRIDVVYDSLKLIKDVGEDYSVDIQRLVAETQMIRG